MENLILDLTPYVGEVKTLVESSTKKTIVLNKENIEELKIDKNKRFLYIFLVDEKPVYVGKNDGSGLVGRLRQHSEGAAASVGTKHKQIEKERAAGNDVKFCIIELCEIELVSLIIERVLIRVLKPDWNDPNSKL